MSDGESRLEVFVLGVPAVLLILLNGLLFLFLGAVAFVLGPFQAAGSLWILGVVAIGLAIGLGVVLWFYLTTDSSNTRGSMAALMVILGSFSLWIGGGFVVGFILAIIAGVIGMVFARSPLPSKQPGESYSRPVGSARALATFLSEPATTGAPPGRSSLSLVVRYCPECDSPNPGDVRVCQKCGKPLPHGL